MNKWLQFAKEDNYEYLVIVYDMEDKEEYPVYIMNNLEEELKNIKLSIRRQEVREVIKIEPE